MPAILSNLRKKACWSTRTDATREALEQNWAPGFECLACLSVRSGFDALLRALAWPPGSEVLVSAVTIRDMPRLLAEHGLVPIPIDVDFDTLTVDVEHLRRAITARTRSMRITRTGCFP